MDTPIEIFPWNENFSTGIGLIDGQHRTLVELLNVLVKHLAYQSDAPSINQILAELTTYSEVHFADEEKIWAGAFQGDEWEALHKLAHIDFIGKIAELTRQRDDVSYEQMLENVVAFLTHWLALHIIEADKRMAKAVRALGTGVPLPRAKEIANEQMSGAARVLIDTVMGMYDTLAHRTIQLTREIGARRKSEEALRHAQEELLLLKDAAVANEQRALRDINNFAYIMAHHLQEPVRQQILFTGMLKRAVPTPPPEAAEALDMVVEGGERLRLLLRDMQVHLSLSQTPWDPAPCDTAEALAEAQRRLAVKIRDKKAEIVPGNLPQAVLDYWRLVDIFTALIDNSLVFCRDGVAPAVTVSAVCLPGHIVFSVEDNGIGIPANMREKAFDIFERVHPHRCSGGTGIGLAVVRKIVDSAGGRVWIESTTGGGTRVSVSLPIPPASADSPPPAR